MAGRSNLTPVTVTDRNGRTTTVYRKPTASAGGRPIPLPDAPALTRAPAPQQTRVGFRIPQWIADVIAGSAPDGAGPGLEGSALLTDDDAFGYLRFGLSAEWGAAMHSVHPDPAYWEQSPAGRRLADHQSRWAKAPLVADSVKLMREHGYTPKAVERMLDHGLTDSHLRGHLTPAQTATLFSKLNFVPPPFAQKDDNAALVRCLTDGTMPIALVEQGTASHETLIKLADFAVKSRTDEREGRKGDGFHAAAEQDASLWSTMAELIDEPRYANAPAASRAWRALKAFGADDCRRFGVKRILANTDAGIPVGEVIREARRLGMGDDEIATALEAHKGRPETVIAIARGEAAPAIADGWL